MNRVFTDETTAAQVLSDVALVIQRSSYSDPIIDHVGIAFEINDEWHIIHLSNHEKFEFQKLPLQSKPFVWIEIAEHFQGRSVLMQLREFCALIARANKPQDLPYGFSLPHQWLNRATGKFISHEPGHIGLTCAIFILAVFDTFGRPLLDTSTWIKRPEDRKFQQWVIKKFAEYRGRYLQHAKKLCNSLPAYRYRPEEVLGSCLCENLPVGLSGVQAKSLLVLRHVNRAFPTRMH